MKLHANAATCPKSRYKIVCRALNGEARERIAAEYEISTRTIAKWVARYRPRARLAWSIAARRRHWFRIARPRIGLRRSRRCAGYA